MSGTRGFRAAALVAAGGIALHELRYVLGYGSGSEHALASHGHEYLNLTTLLVGIVLALAVGQLVAVLARPRPSTSLGAHRASLARVWLAATLALLAVYTAQELVEGMLAPGHPAGLAALTAGGGAWALPLAAAIGLLVALLVRGADAVIAAVSRRSRGPVAARSIRLRASRPSVIRLVFGCILGRNLAGRAPPLGLA